MRLLSTFLAVLLSSSPLLAQNKGNSPAIMVLPPAVKSCPVNFSADRRAIGATIDVGEAPAPHGQGLRINFRTKDVVAVDMTVHGFPSTAQATPATISSGNEVTETFHLSAAATQSLQSNSIWTRAMTAVSWVELTRVDFADGTSWKPSGESRCTAAPSLYVPVSLGN